VVAIGSDALTQIHRHFGDPILTPEKTLNRATLRDIIFNTPAEKSWLEGLLHPLIRQYMIQQLEACTTPYAIAVIPLLVETGIPDFVDEVCVVDCSPETQAKRLLSRDNVNIELIEKILTAQASREQRLALAHRIIDNNADEEALLVQLPALHQQWLRRAVIGGQLRS